MSKKLEKASDLERDERATASVYDFLYHDVRRVGSFISQFHASGLLQSIKETDATGENRASKSGASAGGGLPGIARGQAQFEDQAGSERREASERTYDPLWQNARALLDFLDKHDMIGRTFQVAHIGQFVLASGSLTIMDLPLLKGMWALPAIKKAIAGGAGLASTSVSPARNRSERRKTEATTPVSPHAANMESIEALLSILALLPHAVQARLQANSGETVWCSLNEDSLVVSSSDLILKHGLSVAGTWNILGVLDALPDTDASGTPTSSAIEGLIGSATLEDSPFGQIMGAIAPVVRTLGRPGHAHGITPLMIFREVTA